MFLANAAHHRFDNRNFGTLSAARHQPFLQTVDRHVLSTASVATLQVVLALLDLLSFKQSL